MTANQRKSIILDRWPKVCRVHGWSVKDRNLRLWICSEAVGRQISSMTELNNGSDIDKVFAHLGRLAEAVARTVETLPTAAVDLPAGDGVVHKPDTAGERRRILWLIRDHAEDLGGDGYALRLARDKFGVTVGLNRVEDLPIEKLHQLMITLSARRHRKAQSESAPESAPQLAPELASESDGHEADLVAAGSPF